MSSRIQFPFTFHHQRRQPRRRRNPSSVRFTLLAPPSRLTPEEAAALLRLPRRVLHADLEWRVPGAAEFADDRPDTVWTAAR